MLVLLVFFVFVVLFVSIAISGAIVYFLIRASILQPFSEHRIIPVLLFILMVSLLIGTVISIFGGERILRPMRKMMEATKEVASGNFNIRVDASGAKEIDRLAESFNEMAKELSSIETLRTDFIGNISHEFKTPIVSIRGFARRLRKDTTLSEEQRNEYLDIIISESDRLTRLSSNVLLLSSLESTEKVLEKAPFYLDEQLRRTILLLEPQLQKKQLEVDVNVEKVEIVANEEMLQHLWINLLNNAIKFSPDGSVITIALRQNGDNVTVAVSDRGNGMDEEVKKRIFDKFYQGDKSRATEGNGLGLSLVKRILELDKGSIAVDSQPGKGTCFKVSIPTS